MNIKLLNRDENKSGRSTLTWVVIAALTATAPTACGDSEASADEPSASEDDSGGSGGSVGSGGSGDVVGTGGSGTTPTMTGTTSSTCDQLDGASNLGQVNDCNIGPHQTDPLTAVGTLADAGDADWYEFDGADEAGCTQNPTITVASEGDEVVNIEVCAYFECPFGATEITCNNGAVEETMIDGGQEVDGCCDVTAELAVGVKCPELAGPGLEPTDDSAHGWVSVRSEGAECTDYTITAKY